MVDAQFSMNEWLPVRSAAFYFRPPRKQARERTHSIRQSHIFFPLCLRCATLTLSRSMLRRTSESIKAGIYGQLYILFGEGYVNAEREREKRPAEPVNFQECYNLRAGRNRRKVCCRVLSTHSSSSRSGNTNTVRVLLMSAPREVCSSLHQRVSGTPDRRYTAERMFA